MTSDKTQINRDPRSVTAHSGILSRKPTSSMMVTISSGRAVSDMAVRPEASIMVDTAPWAMLNRAIISSKP